MATTQEIVDEVLSRLQSDGTKIENTPNLDGVDSVGEMLALDKTGNMSRITPDTLFSAIIGRGMVYNGYLTPDTTVPVINNAFYFANKTGTYVDKNGETINVTTEGVTLIQRKNNEWKVYPLWQIVDNLTDSSSDKYLSARMGKTLKDMIDRLAQGGGSGGGGSITVDSELSETSLNPVQNAVITAALNEISKAIEDATSDNSVTTEKIADYAVTENKLSLELGDKINATKVVANKAAADIGVDSTILLQGGIDPDGKENTSSYYLRTSRSSTFKLEVNDGYTIGQIAQYDLAGNFINLYNDYTQSIEGVEWNPTSVVATDKNYYWVAIVFKGNSPTTVISPREDVVKSFASGLYYYMVGGESDPQSAAAQAKTIVNRTIEQLPNTEDLVLVDEKMQLANRAAAIKDGKVANLGYVILRQDKSFTEQVTDENTIYEIRYEFDLNGEEIEIPANCTLKFNGGKINNGTLQCVDTTILGDIMCIGTELKTKGTHSSIDLSWLGVYGSNSDNSAILKTLDRFSCRNFYLSIDCSCTDGDIVLPTSTTISGDGHTIKYSGNSSDGFLILNDDSKISNLSIKSTNIEYSGALILADTQAAKVHQFWLTDIQLGGVWIDASTPNNVVGIKIKAHNTEGLDFLAKTDENNYISGCILRNINCRFVYEAINIECVNYAKILPSTGVAQYNRFAWLNEIYIEKLYAAADKAIRTYYKDYAKIQDNIDLGANNPSDSCGYIMLQNTSFQRWATNGMMFYHEGNWDLNILNAMNWDSTYKGVIIGGTVRATNLRGSYQKDEIGLTDDLGNTYNLVDSIKIYDNGVYHKDSAMLKTYDSYRHKDYNPNSTAQRWDVGVLNKRAYSIKAQHHGMSFFCNNTSRFNSKKESASVSLFETVVYNKDGGGIGREDYYNLLYAPKRHSNSYLANYFRMPKNIDAAYTQNLIASSGLKETYRCAIAYDKIGLSSQWKKGTRYRIKTTPIFYVGDGSYKEYLTIFDHVQAVNPNMSVDNGEIESAKLIRNNEELYIEYVVVLHSLANYINLSFELQYSHTVKPENISTSDDDELYITNGQMFAKEFTHELVESYSVKGISENRPANREVGFQYFDTTLSKPIWWTGSKWVDSTGTEV